MNVYIPSISQEALIQTMIVAIVILIVVGCFRYLIRNQPAVLKKVFDGIFLFFLLGENIPIILNFYHSGILFLFAISYLVLSISVLLYLIIFRGRVYPREEIEPEYQFPQTSSEIIDELITSEIQRNEQLDTSTESMKTHIYERVNLKFGIEIPSSPLICPLCNHQNPNDALLCESCLNEFLICLICKKPIGKKDELYCPFCNATYHKKEFLEWLKVKAYCPNCNTELDMWEVQRYLNEEEMVKFSLFLCPNCKKIIPNDSNFCIFCGFKIQQ